MSDQMPAHESGVANQDTHWISSPFSAQSGFEQGKLNVAICFSGGTRSLDQCFPTFVEYVLNRLQRCNTRIFAHTYLDQDTWKYANISLTSLLVEAQPQFDERDYNTRLSGGQKTGVRGILSQMLGVMRCNDLRKSYEALTQTRFDWILRVRPDEKMLTPLPDLSHLDPSRLHIPRLQDWGGIFDHFAMGGPAVMDIYSNRILFVDQYFGSGSIMDPEGYLANHLRAKRVPVERFPMDMCLIRTPGNEDQFHNCVIR